MNIKPKVANIDYDEGNFTIYVDGISTIMYSGATYFIHKYKIKQVSDKPIDGYRGKIRKLSGSRIIVYQDTKPGSIYGATNIYICSENLIEKFGKIPDYLYYK